MNVKRGDQVYLIAPFNFVPSRSKNDTETNQRFPCRSLRFRLFPCQSVSSADRLTGSFLTAPASATQ